MNYQFSVRLWKILQNRKILMIEDSFYYNRLKYYKNRVLVPLAYMDFEAYIDELKSEREVLSKDINKALKDIEKRPENKKHIIKKKI